jgi:hypothetical protein
VIAQDVHHLDGLLGTLVFLNDDGVRKVGGKILTPSSILLGHQHHNSSTISVETKSPETSESPMAHLSVHAVTPDS